VVAQLPPLVPLVAGPVTLTIFSRSQPAGYEVDGPAGTVGLLVHEDRRVMQALCAGHAWNFTTRRRSWRSWMGEAEELRTGKTVARYYPAFRAGGSIALPDARYALTLPWLRSG
jgi:hypothetical protein